MRQEIKSGSNYVFAKTMRVKRDSIMLVTDEGDRIDISIPEGVPEDLEIPPQGTILTDVKVALNKSEDTIYRYFPATGTHIVSFDSFGAKKGELPTPRTLQGGPRQTKDGRKWYAEDKLVFNANLRVLSGPYKDCIISYMMDYAFMRDRDGTVYLSGGKKMIGKITTFLELCGFDTANETIKWSDNILPELEQILSERADENNFQVIMKDGWIDSLSELPAGLNVGRLEKSRARMAEVFEDDEEDEPRPRRRKTAQVTDEADDYEDVEDLVLDKKVTRPATAKVRRHQPEPDPADDDEVEEQPTRRERPAARRSKVWDEDEE